MTGVTVSVACQVLQLRRVLVAQRLRVGQLEHPDRREQERALEPPAEQLDAGVAMLHVAEHSGHDPPAVEGGAVRQHGPLVSRPRRDVRVRVGTQPTARSLLQAPSGGMSGEAGEVQDR